MLAFKFKIIIAVLAAIFMFNLSPAPAHGQSLKDSIKCGINNASGAACDDQTDTSQSLSTTVRNIINVFSAIIAAIAVIMIIVAGFRFVTSGGDDQAVKSARSTVLYAVIGLVVVALAQIIVQFVLKETTTAGPTSPPSPSSRSTPPPNPNRPF